MCVSVGCIHCFYFYVQISVNNDKFNNNKKLNNEKFELLIEGASQEHTRTVQLVATF